MKILIQMKKRKKEETFSLEEKQSIETGAPSDDHAPIIPISDLDEKNGSRTKGRNAFAVCFRG